MSESPNVTHNPLAPVLVGVLRQIVTLRGELHKTQRERDEAAADRDAYREIAQQSIHALADVTARHQRQAERYHVLLDERRFERQAA